MLSPNETERNSCREKPETKKDFKECAEKLLDMGVHSVVLKLGVRGCITMRPDELFLPGFKVDVVDTTAAGDAFTSALALAWDRHLWTRYYNLQTLQSVGMHKFGAQPSMPRLDEVLKFLRK